jgi:hypothetical protein
MKYLRKFNEGLTQKELKEVRYDLEDVLINIDDLNIKRKDDFLYKIDTYSNSSSMRDISISETFRIDVRFWKNGGFFSWEDFQQLKPVFDTLVRTMNTYSSDVKLVISQWDEDENEFFNEMSYDKMIEYLSFKVGIFDVSNGSGDFLPSKITGFKLKFELK